MQWGASARGVIRFVLISARSFARGLNWFRFATSNLKYGSLCDGAWLERSFVVRRWLLTLLGIDALGCLMCLVSVIGFVVACLVADAESVAVAVADSVTVTDSVAATLSAAATASLKNKTGQQCC